jgi:hypothetical protein
MRPLYSTYTPMVCIVVIDTTYCCICCTSIILFANFTLFICKFHLIIVRQKRKKKKKNLINSFHIILINGKLLQIVSKEWRWNNLHLDVVVMLGDLLLQQVARWNLL